MLVLVSSNLVTCPPFIFFRAANGISVSFIPLEPIRPGPRIRCGAWRQEICAARSLGKRVFRDKIKIATKARKLHYFGKFMEFMMLFHSLVLKLATSGHIVMFTNVWNTLKYKKKSFQHSCAAGNISNQVKDMLTLTAAATLNRLTAKTCFCRLREG